MASEENVIGGSFVLDVSNLKQGLADANRAIKVSNTEFQAAVAGMGDWTKSEEGLNAKMKQLTTNIDVQRQKVDALTNEYEQVVREKGATSKEAENLKIRINNETKSLKESEAALSDTTNKLDNFGKETEDAGKKTEELGQKSLTVGDIISANLISEAIIGGVKALGNAISGASKAMVDMATGAASYADDILTTATNTGMSTEKLQEYSAVAELVDVSTETLTKSMAKNIKSMSTAQSGTGAAAEAYKKLGVAVTDQNGKLRDGEEVYWDAIDALGGIQDETERDALAMEIFGKSAQDLNSLVAVGSKGFEEMSEKAHSMGAVLSDEALASLGAFDDELQVLASTSKATSNILGSAFAPALTDLLGWTNEVGGAFNGMMNTIINGGDVEGATTYFVDTITTMVGDLSNIIPQIIDMGVKLIDGLINGITQALPALLAEAPKLITTIIDGITSAITQLIPVVVMIITTLATALIENLPTILQAGIDILLGLITGITSSIPELIPVIVDAILLIVETLIDNLDMIIDAAIQIILALADGLIRALPKLIEKAPIIIQKLITAITSNMPKIIQMGITLIVELAKGLIKAIPQLISKVPQIMKALISGFTTNIKSMVTIGGDLLKGIWNGLSGAKDWLLKKIKGLMSSITDGIKAFFGIKSPSRLFRDEIGKNMALGIGVGFENEMHDVKKGIINSVDMVGDINSSIGGINGSVNYGAPGSGSLGNVINFTQINNSPKALNRLEVLRQTKNAVGLIGGVS